MEEKLFKIVEWTKIKLRVSQKSSENVYFYSREIWWANIGSNIGFEQDGKNFDFSRPVLILKKFNKNMPWVLPLTSKNKSGNYFYNLHYKKENYTFILPQLKLISSKRLIRKINKISIEDFEVIKNKIKEFL
jgi:mRNA interferase MazF